MKRIIVLMMVLLLSLCIVACGSSTSGNNGSKEEPEKTEKETEEPAEEAVEETEAEEATEEAETEEAVEETSAEFEEIVLVDNDVCVMKITGIDPDDIFGFGLKTYLENKTEDVTLMFSVDECSVNGYMMDPFWAESVAPGKKSNGTITWFSSDFEENGIEDVENIEMKVRVSNENDWMADAFVEEVFEINLK